MPNDVLAISEKLRAELAGLKIKTAEPIYSTVEYGTSGNSAVTDFFAATSVKTVGNVSKARELPEGHVMVIQEIRISAMTDASLADLQEIFGAGTNMPVVEFAPNEDARSRFFPLEILGAGGGVNSATTTLATVGKQQQNAAFVLRVPEVIRGGSPFVAKLHHSAAITPAAATKVRMTFVGIYAYNAAKAAE